MHHHAAGQGVFNHFFSFFLHISLEVSESDVCIIRFANLGRRIAASLAPLSTMIFHLLGSLWIGSREEWQEQLGTTQISWEEPWFPVDLPMVSCRSCHQNHPDGRPLDPVPRPGGRHALLAMGRR